MFGYSGFWPAEHKVFANTFRINLLSLDEYKKKRQFPICQTSLPDKSMGILQNSLGSMDALKWRAPPESQCHSFKTPAGCCPFFFSSAPFLKLARVFSFSSFSFLETGFHYGRVRFAVPLLQCTSPPKPFISTGNKIIKETYYNECRGP